VKYWEIITDNLSNAGWSWGCVSAVDSSGRTIWIVDAGGLVKIGVDNQEKKELSLVWRTSKSGLPEGTATLVSRNSLDQLALQKPPRHAQRDQSGPKQHHRGAAIGNRAS
jgi:hypothetical protein